MSKVCGECAFAWADKRTVLYRQGKTYCYENQVWGKRVVNRGAPVCEKYRPKLPTQSGNEVLVLGPCDSCEFWHDGQCWSPCLCSKPKEATDALPTRSSSDAVHSGDVQDVKMQHGSTVKEGTE